MKLMKVMWSEDEERKKRREKKYSLSIDQQQKQQHHQQQKPHTTTNSSSNDKKTHIVNTLAHSRSHCCLNQTNRILYSQLMHVYAMYIEIETQINRVKFYTVFAHKSFACFVTFVSFVSFVHSIDPDDGYTAYIDCTNIYTKLYGNECIVRFWVGQLRKSSLFPFDLIRLFAIFGQCFLCRMIFMVKMI